MIFRILRRGFALAFGCLGTALLASAPLGAQADAVGMTLHVPDSIGVFAMVQQKQFDDPSLGTMLRYQRADSLFVDVFVYPGADLATGCPRACGAKVLDDEVAGFVASFPEMERRGYGDSISVVTDDALTPARGDAWQMGRRLRLRLSRDGVREQSDYYLLFVPGIEVKLRSTYPPDSSRAIAVAGFSAQIVPALLAQPPIAATESGEKHISVNVTLRGSAITVFDRVVAAFKAQGFAIADSSRANGRIVSAPSFAWPKGSEKDAWHGPKSPGVQLTVTLTAIGDSTRVVVNGLSPLVAEWKDAEVATQLELISVIMLAGKIPKSHPH